MKRYSTTSIGGFMEPDRQKLVEDIQKAFEKIDLLTKTMEVVPGVNEGKLGRAYAKLIEAESLLLAAI